MLCQKQEMITQICSKLSLVSETVLFYHHLCVVTVIDFIMIKVTGGRDFGSRRGSQRISDHDFVDVIALISDNKDHKNSEDYEFAECDSKTMPKKPLCYIL